MGVNGVAKHGREEEAMRSNKQALLSPLSLLVWEDESAADEGTLGAATGASGGFSATKTELKSSGATAQFLALLLDWNWAETFILGPISAKRCLDLKLTWAILSAVRSHDENSFSSRDGPRGTSEWGTSFFTTQTNYAKQFKFPIYLKQNWQLLCLHLTSWANGRKAAKKKKNASIILVMRNAVKLVALSDIYRKTTAELSMWIREFLS